MFLYRRHGSRKRAKVGPGRKPRGPQKGLPNSARDLLPLLQPATKALAQMLAGRTGVSGQLGHARAMLAQAERLIAERGHNRLNPAEREEFFEQLARLKLTLADAEVEAEIQAAEDEVPTPPARPVAQERLKEMALALAARAPKGGPGGVELESTPAADPAAAQQEPAPQEVDSASPATEPAHPPEEPSRTQRASARSAVNSRAGRLELPKSGAEQTAPAAAERVSHRRRSRGAARHHSVGTAGQASDQRATGVEIPRGNGASEDANDQNSVKPTRPRRKMTKHQGVPEGWVIDDEGYVVPGPG